MNRLSPYRIAFCMLALPCLLASAQRVDLKGKVQLTRNGHPAKDSSSVAVWLTPLGNTPVADSLPQSESEIPKLVQKDKSFHPSLVVVPVGGKVEFPNHDPFFHNVFSLFDGKRFDLGLYEAGSTRDVLFDKPGISYIFCNIHAEMSAVVIALTTPYYGISDRRGEIVIPNVPAGRYLLHTWYETALPETLNAMTREITVSEASSTLGVLRLPTTRPAPEHKNMYGRDYPPSAPSSPAYEHP